MILGPWHSTPATKRRAKPTNLTIPEPLREAAREECARLGRSLSEVVSELLTEWLALSEDAREKLFDEYAALGKKVRNDHG